MFTTLTMSTLLSITTFLSAIHFVKCQNDVDKVSFSFYPTDYESIQDVSSMTSWHLDMLENENACINETYTGTTSQNAIDINLQGNKTTAVFVLSQILKIAAFQRYNSSNAQYQNDSLLLDSTNITGIQIAFTKKDDKSTTDYKMYFEYFVNDDLGQQVDVRSNNMALTGDWFVAYGIYDYGNSTNLWSGNSGKGNSSGLNYQNVYQNELKEKFYTNNITFSFQASFDGLTTNNPRIACVKIDLFLEVNKTDYALLQQGLYVFPPKRYRPHATTTSISTLSTSSLTTTISSMQIATQTPTVGTAVPPMITSSQYINGNSTTTSAIGTATSISNSSSNSITNSDNMTTTSANVSKLPQSTEESNKNSLTSATTNDSNSVPVDQIKSSQDYASMHLFDNSSYVIIGVSIVICLCITIAVFTVICYVRKDRHDKRHLELENARGGGAKLERGSSDLSNSVEVAAPIININIARSSRTERNDIPKSTKDGSGAYPLTHDNSRDQQMLMQYPQQQQQQQHAITGEGQTMYQRPSNPDLNVAQNLRQQEMAAHGYTAAKHAVSGEYDRVVFKNNEGDGDEHQYDNADSAFKFDSQRDKSRQNSVVISKNNLLSPSKRNGDGTLSRIPSTESKHAQGFRNSDPSIATPVSIHSIQYKDQARKNSEDTGRSLSPLPDAVVPLAAIRSLQTSNSISITADEGRNSGHAPMISKKFAATTEPELFRKVVLAPLATNAHQGSLNSSQNMKLHDESRRTPDVPSATYQKMMSDTNLQHYALLPPPANQTDQSVGTNALTAPIVVVNSNNNPLSVYGSFERTPQDKSIRIESDRTAASSSKTAGDTGGGGGGAREYIDRIESISEEE